ncbi:hypothetical protein O3P69_002672 [Scylla paramamosain]|uniref:Reverse transcriptase domain-containing protein n=1 Tax=Scylla paramamosain TaxID=85552 RepID=A0AAW0UP94_SCYPA
MGEFHPSLFTFQSRRSTTNCLLTLLGALCSRFGLVVFIELEKACELANPLAIFEVLARKGVWGRLFRWLSGFLTNHRALVSFQGHVPISQPQNLGTCLSQLLFNIMMEELATGTNGRGIQLLVYADLHTMAQPLATSSSFRSLEVAQNEAILRVPNWTSTITLRGECGLPSLQHRIYTRTSISTMQYVSTLAEFTARHSLFFMPYSVLQLVALMATEYMLPLMQHELWVSPMMSTTEPPFLSLNSNRFPPGLLLSTPKNPQTLNPKALFSSNLWQEALEEISIARNPRDRLYLINGSAGPSEQHASVGNRPLHTICPAMPPPSRLS